MLSSKIKDKIRIVFNELADNVPNFNKRFAQNKMIGEVAKILANEYKEHILCVEAPTGTGKTFAYLIAGIIIVKEFDLKLIISTSNVALQEQLLLKDVPNIKKYTSCDFEFALVKGRSRYVCVRNLIQLVDDTIQSNPLFDNTLFNSPPDTDDINNLQDLLTQFESKFWNGEIDNLDSKIDKELWAKIACNRWTCTASKCEFYNDCAFFKARKKIHNADVIIANHDLILADIANNSNILPELNDSFIIFDEAHNLPQKALASFSFSTNIDNIKNVKKQAIEIINTIINITKSKNTIDSYKDIDDFIVDINNYLSQLQYDDGVLLFKLGKVNNELLILINNLLTNFQKLSQEFDKTVESWEQFMKVNVVDKIKKEQIEIVAGECAKHIININNTLFNFTLDDKADQAPQSRWIEQIPQTKNKYNYKLNSAKIDTSQELHQILWSKVRGAILTSATLCSLGSFSRLNKQLGLNDDICQYLLLPSPFNFSKVDFIVAKMQSLPSAGYENTQEVAQQLLQRIEENKGSLVLFASNKQMQDVADIIEKDLSCNLLVQGHYSKQKILQDHIDYLDSKQGSVIFGLDSFAEGVDLKGNYLTHVIIIKLRFSMPNSPIEKTTSDYLASKNIRSFDEISLPDVSLRLVQACGRLIRTESDSGKITIFDKRIITKGYGKQLINNLPNYNIVIEK